MSIPPNLGAIHKLFSAPDWQLRSRNWFEGMGFSYMPVADGHSFSELFNGSFCTSHAGAKIKAVKLLL